LTAFVVSFASAMRQLECKSGVSPSIAPLAAQLYIAMKQHKVPADLHIYQNGGHGYALRDRPDSVISTWPARATEWLKIRKIIDLIATTQTVR